MSVTPELIRSKLSSVDQSSDTIVSVSSWLLFHRRSAPAIVDVWLRAVTDGSSNRKLSLLYLANEVSQQSRAKKRPEYLSAFSRVMPEAIENVFRHATADVQAKITRVIDVWKQRSIFSQEVLDAINQRISSKPKVQRPSSNSSSVPHELTGLSEMYSKLFGITSSSSLALGTTNSLYETLIESEKKPSPDLYAAKLRQLSSSLTLALSTVQNSVKLREEMVNQLQTLLQSTEAALEKDRAVLEDTLRKQEKVKAAAAEVDQMMTDQQANARSTTPEMEPPVAEAITPLMDPEDSDMPVDPFRLEDEPAQKFQEIKTQDPVTKLQMELDPSITALLAQQQQNGTNRIQNQVPEEEEYLP